MRPIRSLRRLVVSLVTLTALVVLCTASSCPPAPTTTLETCTEAALPGLGAKAPGLITQLIADLATGQWFAAVELTASASGPFALCVLDYLRTVWGGGTPTSNAVAARILHPDVNESEYRHTAGIVARTNDVNAVSSGGAEEDSPGRKPWVSRHNNCLAPEGRPPVALKTSAALPGLFSSMVNLQPRAPAPGY